MTRLKSLIASSLLAVGCTFAAAQTSALTPAVAPPTVYTYQTVNFPGDPFTQLLGINSAGVIAGYHGVGTAANPNQGFTLTLPNNFIAENYPGSVQTQVVGINKVGDTVGFFVDKAGTTHGFTKVGPTARAFDFPGTTFNQLLGFNNLGQQGQAAGYWQDAAGNFHPYTVIRYSGVIDSILIPNAVSAQATGINDSGAICGFFIDGKGVNHGFLVAAGKFYHFEFPGATFTQALGMNNSNEVVGTYNDAGGNIHGFTWKNNVYQNIDDPNGVGMTIVNGVNDAGVLVGFYGNFGGGISNGFVATPQ